MAPGDCTAGNSLNYINNRLMMALVISAALILSGISGTIFTTQSGD
jgi:hypothetical protein